MDLNSQIVQLRELLKLLVKCEQLTEKAEALEEAYQDDMESCARNNLPVAPKMPKKPSSPKLTAHVEVDKPAYIVMYLMGIGCLVLLLPFHIIIKKKKAEARRENERIDRENNHRKEEYDRACAEYESALAHYEKARKAFEADKNQRIQNNRDAFVRDNAYRIKELNQVKAQIDDLKGAIAQSTILADRDKTVEVVLFVLDKLESNRADSLMAALNLYDENKRKNSEFQARLMIEQTNHQIERDRQIREETNRRMEAMAFANEMRSIEKERLREQKRAADAIEEIRKMADK